MKNLIDRFWEKVDKKSDNECWNWIGAKNKDGYGIFNLNGKNTSAHRALWIILNSEIELGLQVCHSCDNPSCVNPNHLWLGTDQQNKDDMVKKGRKRKNFIKPYIDSRSLVKLRIDKEKKIKLLEKKIKSRKVQRELRNATIKIMMLSEQIVSLLKDNKKIVDVNSKIPERDKKLLYMIKNREVHSYSHAGKIFGISRQRISQIVNKYKIFA